MKRLLALCLALLSPTIALASSSPPVRTDHLQSRLVSETDAVVPGTQVTLGLLLEHDPHWHTYWRNPGDSGLPVTIELQLPEGVVAAPIAWPHPQRFDVAGIANFGYDGRQLLPVTLTIPAGYAATSLPVRASAKWLVCEKECIPGEAEHALELPVAATAQADAALRDDFAAARAGQPRASPASLALAEDVDAIVLTVRGLDAAASPAQWQWFPETASVVANSARPAWQRVDDAWQARWAKSEYFNAMPAEVALVAVEAPGTAWRFAATPAASAVPMPVSRPSPTGADEPFDWITLLSFAVVGGVIAYLMNRPRRPARPEETDR